MPKHYETEGPFGLPMKDKQAKALERIICSLPKEDAYALRRLPSQKGVSELLPESRSDVSWITVQAPDHAGDLVLAAGMDDSHFHLNPIVTLNHAYDRPPVGRSLWRRKIDYPGGSHARPGVKAKTFYPPRPGTWTQAEWPPDAAFDLVQAGMLTGKSIGFLPLELHAPSAEEIERQPQLEGVRFVITRWLLLEYACCYLPMQPLAVVEEVSKSGDRTMSQAPAPAMRFTSLTELSKALAARIAAPDFERILLDSWQRTLQRPTKKCYDEQMQ